MGGVAKEVGGVAREVAKEVVGEEGREGEGVTREEILLEEMAIREQSEILSLLLFMYSLVFTEDSFKKLICVLQ